MADLAVSGNWLVSPDHEVEMKWKQAAINEKLRHIEGLEVAIKELKSVKILQMEAKIMMLKKEVRHLEDEKAKFTPIDAETND